MVFSLLKEKHKIKFDRSGQHYYHLYLKTLRSEIFMVVINA